MKSERNHRELTPMFRKISGRIAAKQLTEDERPERLLRNGTPLAERLGALRLTRDDSILREIACRAPSARIRALAPEKLQDMLIVEQIAQHDEDPPVRRLAVWRLNDAEFLRHIASDDRDARVRSDASEALAGIND